MPRGEDWCGSIREDSYRYWKPLEYSSSTLLVLLIVPRPEMARN